MKCVVIGLDRYGTVLAIELSELGHEVIVVDTDPKKVEELKDRVTTSYILDASDLKSLTTLPFSSVDVVVVCVGKDFAISLRIVAMLKKMNVSNIYVRAIDQIHIGILEAFKIDKILTPLKDSAKILAYSMDLGVDIELLSIDSNSVVVKFVAPTKFKGFKMSELSLEKEFSVNVIAVTRGKQSKNFLGATIMEYERVDTKDSNFTISEQDIFVCYGTYKSFQQMWRAMK